MRVNQTSSNDVQAASTGNAKKADRASRASEAKDPRKAEKAGSSSAASESARTEISERARSHALAKSVASEAPDIREQKIAELKKRIAEGKYQVDAKAVADRMVDEHLSSGIG